MPEPLISASVGSEPHQSTKTMLSSLPCFSIVICLWTNWKDSLKMKDNWKPILEEQTHPMHQRQCDIIYFFFFYVQKQNNLKSGLWNDSKMLMLKTRKTNSSPGTNILHKYITNLNYYLLKFLCWLQDNIVRLMEGRSMENWHWWRMEKNRHRLVHTVQPYAGWRCWLWLWCHNIDLLLYVNMFDTILVCAFLMFLWNIIKSDTSDISSVKV